MSVLEIDVDRIAGLPGVNLRRAATADLAGLVALEAACFDADQWSESAWGDELAGEDRLVLVAETNGAAEDDACQVYADIVAAACFHVVGQTAELYRVMTAPAWRCLGIATLLLVNGFDWAARQGASEMLLEVRAGNGALSLYTDVGFTPLYERPNYYGPDRHALVMRCGLDGLGAEEERGDE